MTYLMNNLSRFFMKLKCEEKKSSKILLTPTHAWSNIFLGTEPTHWRAVLALHMFEQLSDI